jgi:phosphohistidine phosphatase
MLELYIMRHAKSSWDDLNLSDHDRPLSKRGRKNAKKICELFVKRNISFDLIMLSTSLRTIETLEILKKKIKKPKKIITSKNLYLANDNEILTKLNGVSQEYKSVLLINHEPAVRNLTNFLIKNKNNNLTKLLNYKFSTSAYARVIFNFDNWNLIDEKSGKLAEFIRPKDI